jgi:hypothetical protein
VISLRQSVAAAAIVALALSGGPAAASPSPDRTAAHPGSVVASPKCPKGQSPADSCKAQTDRSSVASGGSLTVTGDGFYPGEAVSIVVHSSATRLSTVRATADGAVTAMVTIPATLGAGWHTLTLTGVSSMNELTAAFAVAAPAGGSARRGGSSWPRSAVLAPVGAGLAMTLAGGIAFTAMRRRRSPRVIRL